MCSSCLKNQKFLRNKPELCSYCQKNPFNKMYFLDTDHCRWNYCSFECITSDMNGFVKDMNVKDKKTNSVSISSVSVSSVNGI